MKEISKAKKKAEALAKERSARFDKIAETIKGLNLRIKPARCYKATWKEKTQ